LVRRAEEVRTTAIGFFKPMGLLVTASALLLMEPDFGAGAVVLATGLGMLFLGGVRFWQFSALMTVTLGMLIVVAVSSPYRLQRITSFVNPWADPYDSGFQLTQSLIAIGSGGWFGVGLGASVQKLFYLPEAHTDFLFAVIAEELGLVGSVSLLLLYAYLVWRAMTIGVRSLRAGRHFGGYLAYGIGLLIGLQAFINIGVNMGVLPTKGLTLPLMSYGGNSVVMTCLAIGLLLRVHYEVCEVEGRARVGKGGRTGGRR
jgi:cell division protein FtsW